MKLFFEKVTGLCGCLKEFIKKKKPKLLKCFSEFAGEAIHAFPY